MVHTGPEEDVIGALSPVAPPSGHPKLAALPLLRTEVLSGAAALNAQDDKHN